MKKVIVLTEKEFEELESYKVSFEELTKSLEEKIDNPEELIGYIKEMLDIG